MTVKMNFRIITKNRAADSRIGSPKNRFQRRWNSQVLPDSLGVKPEDGAEISRLSRYFNLG